MSDSVRPHRQQPTRLSHPWDSPGKNTGAGCHFLLQCMKVKSEREVAHSCLTLGNPMDCSLPGSSVHGIFQAGVLEWVPSPSPLLPSLLWYNRRTSTCTHTDKAPYPIYPVLASFSYLFNFSCRLMYQCHRKLLKQTGVWIPHPELLDLTLLGKKGPDISIFLKLLKWFNKITFTLAFGNDHIRSFILRIISPVIL